MYFTTVPSPLGELTLAGEEALCGLWLPGQKYFGGGILDAAVRRDDLPLFSLAEGWLERYFRGERPSPHELPLRPVGSGFRQAVWRQLLDIPYGRTTTYGKLAEALDRKTSPRAVGGAVGHNPISIIIPCHRVVGSGGSLTGYAGGLAAKKKLLALEGIEA